ncbi:MAG: beta-N-acetylhexosaminidase [Ruminococcaceae bacterium]|nr:beta-N-acetylhexosaminidase [Oscillospiraceae bacterium]
MTKRFGVMLDCSRNAVMKPEKVKEYADLLLKMGYNMLMLYTEDTYEIEGEPYFGYLRGRYTKEELRSISEYCHSIGIEVIPAIQTLGHLNSIFRWGPYRQICDMEPVLLTEDERTYALIRRMFAACREAYPRATVINIGMDEAYGLGLGAYLKKNGYVPAHEILLRHLGRVIEIAKEFDFEPIMWSDMFFHLEHGQYEALNTPEEVKLSDEVIALCPKGVSQVFWRYHSTNGDGYRNMLREHKRFGGESWFAGCAWTWNSMAVSNQATLECTLPAMDACAEENTENIVMTMWGDDGKNCSFFSMLPSLFAVRRWHQGVKDMEQIKKEFEQIIGERFDDMMLLDLPGDYGNTRPYDNTYHKYMLFSDPFCGFLDSLAQPHAKENYVAHAPRLQALADKGGAYAYLYQNMANLCRVMAVKYDLGVRTRAAYEKKDIVQLTALVADYRATGDAVEAFADSMRDVWYLENRPHGFEVQEHRLGGLAYHLRSLAGRLEQFARGEVASIPELEEEILPYWVTRPAPLKEGEVLPSVQFWRDMITVNRT